MKRFTLIAILGFFTILSFAQSHDLNVHGENGKLYLLHTVVAKENWYSVGRIYNVSPKEMAPFNGLTLEHPLSIGQQLKIPLSNMNFSQDGKKNADETFVPVYHRMQSSEMLSHVSAEFNKVPVENLEKWNKIKKDGAKEGMNLIVGYIKVKTSLSYLASEGANKADAVAESKPNNIEETTVIAKPEKKAAAVVEKPKQELKQDNTKTVATTPPPNQTSKAVYTSNSPSNANHINGGYFSTDYSDGGNKATGTAGTFKSSSGWNDGKYYVLINNIPVGTIVKVIAPATQKSVYVKVLGQLPDMKESEGLLLRISNAAANELGEPEGRFGVQVKY
jgi:hypothetical protein